MFLKFLVLFATAFSIFSQAEDFKLDPAPSRVLGVIVSSPFLSLPRHLTDSIVNESNDLESVIKAQTPIKSQGRRGTCSIFASTGELESLLKIRDGKELDVSENYLEYLVQTRIKSVPSGGSDTPWNMRAFQSYGAVMESDFPYDIYDWNESDIPEEEVKRAMDTCGGFTGNRKAGCLYGHMDPSNDRYRESAEKTRRELSLDKLRFRPLYLDREVKNVLDDKKPLLLGLHFFYKAWNHRKMEEYGLGERDMEAWSRGEVGIPTAQDIEVGQKHPAGHSIVVVGYNEKKKVYYFKNSWGKGSFGVKSDLLGSGTTDGYGSIPYEYVNRFGTFHEVSF